MGLFDIELDEEPEEEPDKPDLDDRMSSSPPTASPLTAPTDAWIERLWVEIGSANLDDCDKGAFAQACRHMRVYALPLDREEVRGVISQLVLESRRSTSPMRQLVGALLGLNSALSHAALERYKANLQSDGKTTRLKHIDALGERLLGVLELSLGRPRLDHQKVLRMPPNERTAACTLQESMGRVWDERHGSQVESIKDGLIAKYLAAIVAGTDEGLARHESFVKANAFKPFKS